MNLGPLRLLATAAAAYLLAAAVASPLHTRAEEQLSLHMLQHLMIVVLARGGFEEQPEE